jgi:hypothetical protein
LRIEGIREIVLMRSWTIEIALEEALMFDELVLEVLKVWQTR